MGQFRHIVERIARIIEEMKGKGGISADSIPDILNDLFGGELGNINCYPGKPGDECHNLSLFLSLTVGIPAKSKRHLNCRQAMECIVQHMQGSCFEKTHYAVHY